MAREKFQRKQYFFHENDRRFYPQFICKSVFLIGQVPIKKYGLKTWSLLFHTLKIEFFLLKCFHPTPGDQINPFAYSCSFEFHTSYENGMIGHRGAFVMIVYQVNNCLISQLKHMLWILKKAAAMRQFF